MIRDAVTCDRDGCLAVFLEPDDLPDGPDVFESAMAAAGWTWGRDGHRCPACATGRSPVLERGECPRCIGRQADRPNGAACQYCGHLATRDEDESGVSH